MLVGSIIFRGPLGWARRNPPPGVDSFSEQAILKHLARKIGPMLVTEIQRILGTSEVYSLSGDYAIQKQLDPRLWRVPGKDADQPLILTGEHIYKALKWEFTSDGLNVYVDDSMARDSKGFDIAAYWDSGKGSKRGFSGVHYMQKAWDNIENKIGKAAEDVLMELIVGKGW